MVRRKDGNDFFVRSIVAAAGKATRFVIAEKDGEPSTVTSKSPVIQAVLTGAFLTGAGCRVPTDEGTDNVYRVNPFPPGPGCECATPASWRISRAATGPGDDRRLEVFLVRPDDPDERETAFNVFDPLLVQLMMAAFRPRADGPPPGNFPLHVMIDREDEHLIVGVAIGEMPAPGARGAAPRKAEKSTTRPSGKPKGRKRAR